MGPCLWLGTFNRYLPAVSPCCWAKDLFLEYTQNANKTLDAALSKIRSKWINLFKPIIWIFFPKARESMVKTFWQFSRENSKISKIWIFVPKIRVFLSFWAQKIQISDLTLKLKLAWKFKFVEAVFGSSNFGAKIQKGQF